MLSEERIKELRTMIDDSDTMLWERQIIANILSKNNIILHKAIENPEDVCFNCLKETKVNKIYIGEMGYGSGFDGWSTRINLCDECIKLTNKEWWKLEKIQCEWDKEDNHGFYEYKYEDKILKFVNKMPVEGKELFYNRYPSGWNSDHTMNPQDWIDYELDILPHEKCKEYGMYSPEERKAYKEQFPKCQHPVNIVYNDDSKGCWCPFKAHGEYGQKCDKYNISDKCYRCKYFKVRTTLIKDISNKDHKDYDTYAKAKLNEEKYKKKFE